jgi:hypothetical protein
VLVIFGSSTTARRLAPPFLSADFGMAVLLGFRARRPRDAWLPRD